MAVKLTIIGAGPGGYVAAIRAAQRGAQVTVLEEQEVGGTCLHRGCIPTKTLISSAETLHRVRRSEEFGIELPGEAVVNLEKIRARRDKVIATQVKGIRSLFSTWGIRLLSARGSLLAPDVVRVVQADGTTMDLSSDRIIIATGSRPATVPGFVIDGERVLSSDDAVRLSEVPKSLVIIGAGVIGCEFAFIYRTLGAEVTLVEMMPRALATEDEEISAVIERELKKAKIRLITGDRVGEVRRGPAGSTLQLASGKEVNAEKVLLSIGRRMNTEDLGLELAGVAQGDRGELAVNDRMETNIPGIYAIGDVTGTMMLAHVASRQGLVAVENALGGDARMDYSAVPSGIFTMPEIGSVGIREHQAAQKGIAVSIGRFPYRALGKAHAMGEIAGMVKVIADARTDVVLGAHIIGAHATDLIHEAALAIRTGTTARVLGSMIHAHPTLAEAIGEAAEDVHGDSIHGPKRER